MKSVLLKGKSLLEDTARLGTAVETAVFKHHNVRHFRTSGTLSWWRGGCGEHEVDFVEESPDGLMPSRSNAPRKWCKPATSKAWQSSVGKGSSSLVVSSPETWVTLDCSRC